MVIWYLSLPEGIIAMSLNSDELNLPWKIYFFDKNGKYDKKDVLTIQSTDAFINQHTVNCMKRHNENKLEIRVCDSLDYCIMHWKDGRKVFPK